MIKRKPTTVLVIGGENTVGQPPMKAARPMALPCRIVDTDCDKLPVEKSEAQVIQMHGRRSSGAFQTLRTSNAAEWNGVLSKMRQHDFHHLPHAVTVKDQRLEKLGQTIGENLGHVGILDCDLFVSDEGCSVIDLNPRIGGGYPFSHMAGANVPAALIAWINGEEADPRCFQIQPHVAVARCDEYVAISPPQTASQPRSLMRHARVKSTKKQLR